MSTKKDWFELLALVKGGPVNLPGVEEHRKIFGFRTLNAAAKDLYLRFLETDWGQKNAKRHGLI